MTVNVNIRSTAHDNGTLGTFFCSGEKPADLSATTAKDVEASDSVASRNGYYTASTQHGRICARIAEVAVEKSVARARDGSGLPMKLALEDSVRLGPLNASLRPVGNEGESYYVIALWKDTASSHFAARNTSANRSTQLLPRCHAAMSATW